MLVRNGNNNKNLYRWVLASASASASWVVASASWVVASASASASWVVASASASWGCGLVTSLLDTPPRSKVVDLKIELKSRHVVQTTNQTPINKILNLFYLFMWIWLKLNSIGVTHGYKPEQTQQQLVYDKLY